MKELIADVSHYNNPVDYKGLKDAGFVSVIAKAGQGMRVDSMVKVHAAGTKAAGMYLGIYYWPDPLQDEVQQAEHAAELADLLHADYIAGDNEQWWADWAKWERAIMRKIPWSDVPKLSSKQINKASRGFLDHLAKIQSRRLLNYTSIGFINTYCRDMLTWINVYSTWLAQYHATGPNKDLKRQYVTFDQLKALYLPITEPYYPQTMDEPTAWQWTGDRFTAPGNLDAMDISFWWNRVQTIGEWVGGPQPEPVVLPWQDKRLKSWVRGLNVREAPNSVPGTKILRILVPGLQIRIVPDHLENGVWAKLYGEPGYIHSGYIE